MMEAKKEYNFGGIEVSEFEELTPEEESNLLLKAYAVIPMSSSDGARSMGGDDMD